MAEPMSEALSLPAPPYYMVAVKGWKLVLDHERLYESDAWVLAAVAQLQGLLLLMWLTAWRQYPAGSLPADDALIAAHMGVQVAIWQSAKGVLLRDWWKASDGRLYHPVITTLVLEMLEARTSNAARVAKFRKAKTGTVHDADSSSVSDIAVAPNDRVSNAIPTHKKAITNDTRTRTGTRSKSFTEDFNVAPGASDLTDDSPLGDAPPLTYAGSAVGEPIDGLPDPSPTSYGLIAGELRRFGIQSAAHHPRFRALVDAGATAQEFLAFADKSKGHRDPFAYLMGCVEGERKRAKATASQLHRGAMPTPAATKSDALMASNIAAAQRFLERDEHGA